MPTLGFVHTVHRLIPGLAELGRELFPTLEQAHFLDESVLREAIVAEGLTPDLIRRVCDLIVLAAAGSDLVLVTCSSIGPCVEVARHLVPVPVLRIDRPMCDQAVTSGRRIGVLASLQTTLSPTLALLETCALEADVHVTVKPALCEGAFAAAAGGDLVTHDRLVLEGWARLTDPADPVDVVVLAQASLARVLEQLPPTTIPVLSSPRSGVQRAGETLLLRTLGG